MLLPAVIPGAVAAIDVAAAEITASGAIVAGAAAMAAAAKEDFNSYKKDSDYYNKLYCEGKSGIPEKLQVTDQQLGKKAGEHGAISDGKIDFQKYKQKIMDIFENPDEIRFGYANGAERHLEYFYIKGDDVLRVMPDGSFVSMYEGAMSADPQNAVILIKNR